MNEAHKTGNLPWVWKLRPTLPPPKEYLSWQRFVQLKLVNWSRPILHSLPRHRPYDFETLTNEFNLTNHYWEGCVNCALVSVLPAAAICTMMMFICWVYSLPAKSPSPFCVSCYKILISIIGLLCLLLAALVVYASPGVTYTWLYLYNVTILKVFKDRACSWVDGISPKMLDYVRGLSEESITMLKQVEADVQAHPGYEEELAKVIHPWEAFKKWISLIEQRCLPYQNASYYDFLLEFTTPFCEMNLTQIQIGGYNFFDRINYFDIIITCLGFLLAVWTMYWSYILATICTIRSKIYVTFTYIAVAVTPIFWWALAFFTIPLLIGTADVCSREVETMTHLVQHIQPNMTEAIVGHYILCNMKYFTNPLSYELLKPHYAYFEMFYFASDSKEAYKSFLPELQKEEYVDFLKEMTSNTYDMAWLAGHVGSTNTLEKCVHSRLYYLEHIYNPICIVYHWNLLICTLAAMAIAPLLTLAVLMCMRIQNDMKTFCGFLYSGKKPRLRYDELVCLPECQRQSKIPAPSKYPRKCPPTCPGAIQRSGRIGVDGQTAKGEAGISVGAEGGKGLYQRLPIPEKYGIQVEVPQDAAVALQKPLRSGKRQEPKVKAS